MTIPIKKFLLGGVASAVLLPFVKSRVYIASEFMALVISGGCVDNSDKRRIREMKRGILDAWGIRTTAFRNMGARRTWTRKPRRLRDW